jgi:hypothetical protein
MTRRRSCGAATVECAPTVEWIVRLVVAAGIGVGTVRAVQSRAGAAADHAADCIAGAGGNSTCQGVSSRDPAPHGSNVIFDPLLSGSPPGFSAAELIDKVRTANGDKAKGELLDQAERITSRTLESAIDLGRALDGLPTSMKVLFGAMFPGTLLWTSETGRSVQKGIVIDGAGGMVWGLMHLVVDPLGTVENLDKLNTALNNDPEGTTSKIWNAIKQSYERDPARFLGNVGFQIASLFTGVGEVGEAGEAANVAGKAGELGRTIEGIDEAGRTAEEINQIGRTAEETSQAGRTAEEINQIGRTAEETNQAGRTAEETNQAGRGGEAAQEPQSGAAPAPEPSPVQKAGGLEPQGGHLVEKHVGKSDAELAQRLVDEPKLTYASTFESEQQAEEMVSSVMRQRSQEIADWAAQGAKGKRAFDGVAAGGRVMERGVPGSVAGTGARVVLKGDGKGGYFILTGFPTK